jgi:hypothetical protein
VQSKLKQEKGESNYLAEIDGSGFQENNISTNNKMTNSKKSKKANAMHQEMFGSGMHEMGLDDMEGCRLGSSIIKTASPKMIWKAKV